MSEDAPGSWGNLGVDSLAFNPNRRHPREGRRGQPKPIKCEFLHRFPSPGSARLLRHRPTYYGRLVSPISRLPSCLTFGVHYNMNCSGKHVAGDTFISRLCYIDVNINTSTLLFLARPSLVLFDATGCESPAPTKPICCRFAYPLSAIQSATFAARRSERHKL
jgi:hypothetical protein